MNAFRKMMNFATEQKCALRMLGLALFIAALVIAKEPTWNWLVAESKKDDVKSVAELLGKFAPTVGAFAVGFFTLFLGWRQWRTADAMKQIAAEKLRFDLSVRRYEAYQELMNISQDVSSWGGRRGDYDDRIMKLTDMMFVLFDRHIYVKFQRIPFFIEHDFPKIGSKEKIRAEPRKIEILRAYTAECISDMASKIRFD